MVFHLHGQAPYGRIETGTLGNCPALHYPIELQAQIIVQVAGCVLLNDEGELLFGGGASAFGFGGASEIALAPVFRELFARTRRRLGLGPS